jgi:hypothetical protein
MAQGIHASLVTADTVFHLTLLHGHKKLGARKMECKVIIPVGSVNFTDSVFTYITCVLVHCNPNHVIRKNFKV